MPNVYDRKKVCLKTMFVLIKYCFFFINTLRISVILSKCCEGCSFAETRKARLFNRILVRLNNEIVMECLFLIKIGYNYCFMNEICKFK